MEITWVGHATCAVRVAGLTLLTDPIVTARVAHLWRRVAPAPALAPDVVLISHLHLDHLHVASLARVVGRTETPTQLIVPAGAAPLVRRLRHAGAVTVTEVEQGDAVPLVAPDGGTVVVTVTAARHSCKRGPHSRLVADPVGYVVAGGGRTGYFAGDTDLFPGMRELGPIDVALLPIWGWGPTLGDGHLDPERAAEAVEWIRPTHVVPIHWGTYSPIRPLPGAPAWIDNPLGAFGDALAERDLRAHLVALRPGESFDLAAAQAAGGAGSSGC